MTYQEISKEIMYFRAKYPEYDDWFMDDPNQLRAVANDLREAGWNCDADCIDFLADEWQDILDKV